MSGSHLQKEKRSDGHEEKGRVAQLCVCRVLRQWREWLTGRGCKVCGHWNATAAAPSMETSIFIKRLALMCVVTQCLVNELIAFCAATCDLEMESPGDALVAERRVTRPWVQLPLLLNTDYLM